MVTGITTIRFGFLLYENRRRIVSLGLKGRKANLFPPTVSYMQIAIAPRQRILSIDFLRGIVMVIMALDHVRDLVHSGAMTGDPTDMATTTPVLFFTRWITHFCAPIFVFLSGTSAFLYGQKRSKKELSLFLLKRGLWLVIVEIVVITFGITFNPFYNFIILQVIWAIGISMILLSALIWLPFPVLLAIGLLIVFGHNSLDKAEAARQGNFPLIWHLLHTPNSGHVYAVDKSHFVLIAYAFPAWTGIMILGYCLGKLYRKETDPAYRKKILLVLGSSAVLLFILLRFLNVYGDRSLWSVQRNGIYTLLSFLNTTKYPPSLLYTLMTLGPALLFLAFSEKAHNLFSRIMVIYGRVPFFYYVLHFYLIHIIVVILFFATGHTTAEIVSQSPFFFRPVQFGFNLWVVYAVWLFVVAALYPLCRWYNRYKSTHHYWWLSYL